MTSTTDLRAGFRSLHTDPPTSPTPGILVMPNPWDVGSAKLLVALGARALATTSAGHAGALGRLDQNVQRDELLAHAAQIAAAVDVPVNVDSEDCFADTVEGVAETASMLASTGVAGFSIEDYDPRADSIREIADAAARVSAAKAAGGDLVLTARAENYLYGIADLDDTITRLIAFREAGADVLYAPGIRTPADISAIVGAVGAPVNVLAIPGTPSIPELAGLGVARVSTGSLLAWAAYGALADATREIFGPGTHTYAARLLDGSLADAAFGSSE